MHNSRKYHSLISGMVFSVCNTGNELHQLSDYFFTLFFCHSFHLSSLALLLVRLILYQFDMISRKINPAETPWLLHVFAVVHEKALLVRTNRKNR